MLVKMTISAVSFKDFLIHEDNIKFKYFLTHTLVSACKIPLCLFASP